MNPHWSMVKMKINHCDDYVYKIDNKNVSEYLIRKILGYWPKSKTKYFPAPQNFKLLRPSDNTTSDSIKINVYFFNIVCFLCPLCLQHKLQVSIKQVIFITFLQIPWEDNRRDPFQDITIGGASLPRQPSGYLAVWALTFSGKVSKIN